MPNQYFLFNRYMYINDCNRSVAFEWELSFSLLLSLSFFVVIYLIILISYLFIDLFVYLFVYLFIDLFYLWQSFIKH